MRKCILFIVASIVTGTAVYAQNADSIIGRHIEAIGGRGKISLVKTIHIESYIDQRGVKIPLVINAIHQKGIKQEYTFGGMTGYDITTDTAGWYFSPFNGMTQPDTKTVDDWKSDLTDMDLQGVLFDYKAKGYQATYIEKDDVDGVECYVVMLTLKNNVTKKFFFDPSSYFILKETTKAQVDGQEQNNAVVYSNYQKTDFGIIMPFTQDSFGQINIVEKVVTNGPIDTTIFKRTTTTK